MKITQIVLIVLIVFSGACASTSSTSEVTEEVISTTISPPAQGLASVTGRVIHTNTEDPFVDTIVRLAEVVRAEEGEDVFVLDQAFSPGTRTDEAGYFVFEDVDPMEYVIVVGDVTGIYEIIPDDSGEAKVWSANADEVLDVGELMVKLEPTQP